MDPSLANPGKQISLIPRKKNGHLTTEKPRLSLEKSFSTEEKKPEWCGYYCSNGVAELVKKSESCGTRQRPIEGRIKRVITKLESSKAKAESNPKSHSWISISAYRNQSGDNASEIGRPNCEGNDMNYSFNNNNNYNNNNYTNKESIGYCSEEKGTIDRFGIKLRSVARCVNVARVARNEDSSWQSSKSQLIAEEKSPEAKICARKIISKIPCKKMSDGHSLQLTKSLRNMKSDGSEPVTSSNSITSLNNNRTCHSSRMRRKGNSLMRSKPEVSQKTSQGSSSMIPRRKSREAEAATLAIQRTCSDKDISQVTEKAEEPVRAVVEEAGKGDEVENLEDLEVMEVRGSSSMSYLRKAVLASVERRNTSETYLCSSRARSSSSIEHIFGESPDTSRYATAPNTPAEGSEGSDREDDLDGSFYKTPVNIVKLM